MAMGEAREISDKAIAHDLLKVGYIEELKETKIKKVVGHKGIKSKKRGQQKNED